MKRYSVDTNGNISNDSNGQFVEFHEVDKLIDEVLDALYKLPHPCYRDDDICTCGREDLTSKLRRAVE